MVKKQVVEEESNLPVERGGGITIRKEQLPEYMAHAGPRKGFEKMTREEKTFPRLAIVQAMSPIRKKTDPSFNPDAEEGMLYNTLTGDVYGDNVYVVPLTFFMTAINADPDGGIICMSQDSYSCPKFGKCKCREWDDPESKDGKPVCTALFNYACVVLDKDNELLGLMVLSLKSTGVKVGKKWNGLMDTMPGDMFSYRWRVNTFPTKNDSNQEFYQWKFSPAGKSPEDLYAFASSAYDNIKDRDVQFDARGITKDDEYAGREVSAEM